MIVFATDHDLITPSMEIDTAFSSVVSWFQGLQGCSVYDPAARMTSPSYVFFI